MPVLTALGIPRDCELKEDGSPMPPPADSPVLRIEAVGEQVDRRAERAVTFEHAPGFGSAPLPAFGATVATLGKADEEPLQTESVRSRTPTSRPWSRRPCYTFCHHATPFIFVSGAAPRSKFLLIAFAASLRRMSFVSTFDSWPVEPPR